MRSYKQDKPHDKTNPRGMKPPVQIAKKIRKKKSGEAPAVRTLGRPLARRPPARPAAPSEGGTERKKA